MRTTVAFIAAVVLAIGIICVLPIGVEAPLLWWLEVCAVLLLAALALIYKSLIRPVRALNVGMLLLNEQDFASRLSKVGQREADNIAEVFNQLMETLKNERLRAQEQNQLLDLIIKASPMGIVIFDLNGRVAEANDAAITLLDTAEIYGLSLNEIPGELPVIASKLKVGEDSTVRLCDNRVIRCSVRGFFDRGFQRRFLLLETLTEEVMKAERAAYGKVIRVISHEVNNTLAGVIPLFDTVAAIADDDLLRETAESCADRCSSLGRFIKNYADVVKVPEPVLAPCELNSLLRSLHPFLESITAGKDISLSLNLDADSVIVHADTVLLEQVLVNVVKNAVESIGNNGEIVLRTVAIPPTLEVIDNGKGISADISGKLFTPFFSTKDGSQGIGLTLVAEILHRHKCNFRIATSDADGLTRFSVIFS